MSSFARNAVAIVGYAQSPIAKTFGRPLGAVPGLDGGFMVEVAVPEHIGRRYVESATPLGGEQLMLGGYGNHFWWEIAELGTAVLENSRGC